MRLVSAVLGFVLRKAGALVVLVLSLFVGYLLVQALVPAIREAVSDRDRLEQVAEERAGLETDLAQLKEVAEERRSAAVDSLQAAVGTELDSSRQKVADQKAVLEDRLEEADDCSRLRELVESLPVVPNTCELKERAAEAARETLTTLERGVATAEARAEILTDPSLSNQEKLSRLGEGSDLASTDREIEDTEAVLGQKKAEERTLEQAQGSGVGWVVDQWAKSWKWLALVALLALVMPALLRVVSYFVLMPAVKRAHRPIHLSAGSEEGAARLDTSEALRTLTVELADGEVMSARSEHVRPVQGRISGRLLYDWSSPFISFAAGLYGLSRVTGDERGTSATLSTPGDPDSYLMRIDFTDHPGVVMRPRHVVGVIGTPELETRWRFGIQSFATWQVRYILFAGTGSLIVQGSGDVVATDPGGRSTRMEQNLVMGFDSRLSAGVNRTEVFWPYLWGRTPLVDDEFTGIHPLFWQKATADGSRNPIARTFDAFFSALGKVLGF
ncbi:hypothetical protein [Nocardioides hwasunensis]|uniref:DUF3068 domain-containing protein n=1 Tax=Nocardioides hwasunensis TaxID=397258 RepID=A0ABR8MEK7_9ACTN|nr:hypothetical protein [Nocardioides hwasunensis]MBD3914540.1 hypothetical protein [Nocardioides hwasunensis]